MAGPNSCKTASHTASAIAQIARVTKWENAVSCGRVGNASGANISVQDLRVAIQEGVSGGPKEAVSQGSANEADSSEID